MSVEGGGLGGPTLRILSEAVCFVVSPIFAALSPRSLKGELAVTTFARVALT